MTGPSPPEIPVSTLFTALEYSRSARPCRRSASTSSCSTWTSAPWRIRKRCARSGYSGRRCSRPSA